MHKNRTRKKQFIYVIVTLFILINIFIIIQVYGCTHYATATKNAGSVIDTTASFSNIIRTIILGIDIPKPKAKTLPSINYEPITIQTEKDENISAWFIRTDSVSKGVIIYFHGYLAEKSMMLDYSYETIKMGYDALLIDFRGSGDSDGNQVTIGDKEASDVKTAFDFAKNNLNANNIYLFGFSMGATAVLKAQHEYKMPAKGIIAEAAYGRMVDTVQSRIKRTGLVSYPLAYLITFWGSAINAINGFELNPEEYAKSITIPTLIACGNKDQYIPVTETQRIFDNLGSKNKTLIFYPNSIHELYLNAHSNNWIKNINNFLVSTIK